MAALGVTQNSIDQNSIDQLSSINKTKESIKQVQNFLAIFIRE